MSCRGAVGVAALLLTVGCGQPVPVSPSVTPGGTPAASAVQSPRTDAAAAGVTVEEVPTDHLPAALATDGQWIAWSAADEKGEASPDIYRWRPGASQPELVYRNDERRAAVQLMTLQGDRYAFSEVGAAIDGFISWTFSYLPRPGGRAVKLATARRPVDSRGLLPQPALSDRYLAYAIQRINAERTTSELVVLNLETMESRVVGTADFFETEYWYPALDGERLVFGTVEYANADDQNGARHVYLLDLGDEQATPKRLDRDGDASQPAIHGDTVIWKTAPPEFNANSAGQLVRYSIPDDRVEKLTYGRETTDYGLTGPFIGNRFVSAEESVWTTISVWDLETEREIIVEEADPRGDPGFMRPSLAGDLLTWIAAPDFTGIGGRIHYAWLPPAST